MTGAHEAAARRALDEAIQIWVDEAASIPSDWPWRAAQSMMFKGLHIYADPTLERGRAQMGGKSDLKAARLERMAELIRKDRLRATADYAPIEYPLAPMPVAAGFTPPPLTIVRSDQLSRLWSRKS